MGKYVVARGSGGRPCVQHRVSPVSALATTLTACGQVTEYWSRGYMDDMIDVLFCHKCLRIMRHVGEIL